MEDTQPGPAVWDINKVLTEWRACLLINNDGEQIQFEKEEDRVMFLLRYS